MDRFGALDVGHRAVTTPTPRTLHRRNLIVAVWDAGLGGIVDRAGGSRAHPMKVFGR
jgi:hypothetical protein